MSRDIHIIYATSHDVNYVMLALQYALALERKKNTTVGVIAGREDFS
jgi:hypothetical protein